MRVAGVTLCLWGSLFGGGGLAIAGFVVIVLASVALTLYDEGHKSA